MANGRLYGDSYSGYSYSPNRAYDVDRFNPSTRGNYNYFDPYRQGYYSPDRSYDTERNYYGGRKSYPAEDLFG